MLHLYVYDPDDDFDGELPPSAMRPASYRAAPPSWIPALEETWLLLDVPGGEPLQELNPFGYLDALARQMAEAAARLDAGERALIRSAGDWTPVFLAFEPDGAVVRVSALAGMPQPYSSYYPLDRSPFHMPVPVDQPAELYRYVEAHRDELRPTAADGRAYLALQRLDVPAAPLIACMREEARAGMSLYEAIVASRT
jgi:hypothetical protein